MLQGESAESKPPEEDRRPRRRRMCATVAASPGTRLSTHTPLADTQPLHPNTTNRHAVYQYVLCVTLCTNIRCPSQDCKLRARTRPFLVPATIILNRKPG